jgi:hypothetical protein
MVFANGVLYMATEDRLLALKVGGAEGKDRDRPGGKGSGSGSK